MVYFLHVVSRMFYLTVLLFAFCHCDNLEDILTEQWELITTKYLRYDATNAFLDKMKQSFPDLVDYYSIGKSVQGREMYVAKLAQDVTRERPLLVPMIRMVASMHGDETLGKQLLMMLIVDLMKEYRANGERAKRILGQTEIHLLLTMNPDGYEVAVEGDCLPDENKLGKLNANLKDLNHDFPDSLHREAVEAKPREPETSNVIKWTVANKFVLSVNFFAGEIVALYPFFTVFERTEKLANYTGKGVALTTNDEDVSVHLAATYAKNHKSMTVNKCNNENDVQFENGIINGAQWQNTKGNMHDFTYFQRCKEISVGLSCCKSVQASVFAEEWENNKESLYKFIEAVHLGVKGIVSKDGKPVVNAIVMADTSVTTNERGEYWAILLPGEYESIAALSPDDDDEAEVSVTLEKNDPPKATILDFEIKKHQQNLTVTD